MTFIRPWKSIHENPIDDPLPPLVVLTGPNGAGKSQVLDAIEAGCLQVDGVPMMGTLGQVRVFRLSELMAQVEAPQSIGAFRERWAQVAQHIRNIVQGNQNAYPQNPGGLDQLIIDNIRANRMLSEGALSDLVSYLDKPLSEYSLNEIRDALPLQHAEVDPFRLSVSEVFATYFLRRDNNSYQRYKEAQGLDAAPYLSDDDFTHKYGPPPWLVLNEALLAIGLDYEFSAPVEIPESLPYSPVLRRRGEDLELQVENLSTGERTLLAIALSLYTGSSRASSYLQLPRILLLDEADASLHPSMVVGLINVLQDVFVATHGVHVIMTSHSPSTVAIAPEESLFQMRRGVGRRMRKVTKDQAIAALAVGIPTLSVRVEDRRTVVVEEQDDVQVYEHIYRLVRGEMTGPRSLQFVSSGSGSAEHPENSGSSFEVRRLVRELRGAGNDTIFGIIDRDAASSGDAAILVSEERYSIENYALDPLLVGALLLMQNFATAQELGLPVGTRHFALGVEHSSSMVAAIAQKLNIDEGARTSVTYRGGFSVPIPDGFLSLRGHDLQNLYVDRYPMLRRYRKLMQTVLEMAARDVPQFIPGAVVALLDRLTREEVG
ncbi:Predicted ATPase [Klenkia marina]|uniref:Predicted ATPase n=1 Tax=Klenkia marina TaxID=1960309 RepID=A0A1G4XSY0_9ACTN|nr:AAA family ATPase [Klenkia marina]SCX44319.1 Predicted ATPase [Klenkia marina]